MWTHTWTCDMVIKTWPQHVTMVAEKSGAEERCKYTCIQEFLHTLHTICTSSCAYSVHGRINEKCISLHWAAR